MENVNKRFNLTLLSYVKIYMNIYNYYHLILFSTIINMSSKMLLALKDTWTREGTAMSCESNFKNLKKV